MPLPKLDPMNPDEFLQKVRLQGDTKPKRLVKVVKLEQEGIIIGNDLTRLPQLPTTKEDGT